MRYVKLLKSLYRYRNWNFEKLSHLPLVMLGSGRTSIQPRKKAWFQSLCSESLCWTAPACCCNSLLSYSACLPSSPQRSKAGTLIPFTDKFVALQVNFLNLPPPPSQICLHFYSSSLHPSISRKVHPSFLYSSPIPSCLLDDSVL